MPGTITRWDPFTELADLRARFDRMLGDHHEGRLHDWTPAMDLMQGDGSLVMRVDIPGIKPEEVKIEVSDDVLTVSGEHEERKEEKDEHFVRRERHFGSFTRSMALPAGVDAERIEAKTHDGVLEVTIPLPEDSEKQPVQITPTAA